MRSLRVPFVLCLVLVVLTPIRADAWFGFLDYLSGPGPFKGALFDVRLACFGPDFTVTANLQAKLAIANARSITAAVNLFPAPGAPALAGVPPDGGVGAAAADWKVFLEAVTQARVDFPVLPSKDIQDFGTMLGELMPSDYVEFGRQLVQLSAPQASTNQGANVQAPAASRKLATVIARAQKFVEQFHRANVSINSTAVLGSLCKPDKTRRFGVDLAVDFYQAGSDPRFANDHTIALTIVMPSLTYRIFNSPYYDLVDAGAGIGMYRFSSRGFDTFTGLVLQPHLDFHLPTRLVNSNTVGRAFSLLTVRYGYTQFPAGFEAGAFGPGTAAIPKEWTETWALYFNLTPLLSRPKPILGIR